MTALTKKFVWGEVVKDHVIGDYVIREYIEKGTDTTAFHIYIKGEDMCCSFETLDSALIGAIAIKYDGANTQANTFFERAIDLTGVYSNEPS
ncbi:hypothetical protein JCM19235_1353 [Vibrio maritimus]|uniref:Uncharacterized protein n=1 Tax=Vibrio maritimus TaxID=990268 RepID=A0A090SUQ4_9VIBR|nr:hypothetical protein JCM19235_1353 [Vibrio maritimus]